MISTTICSKDLFVFGSAAYVHITVVNRKKLDAKTELFLSVIARQKRLIVSRT